MANVGRHGEGGVTRRKDGRLQVAITLTSGRRLYRTIPRLSDPKRQRELAERTRRELVAIREAELDPSGQTVAVYLRSWLASMASAVNPRIRPNTLAFYTTIAEKHLIPALGEVRLENLRERHVQAWLDGLALSPQYRRRTAIRSSGTPSWSPSATPATGPGLPAAGSTTSATRTPRSCVSSALRRRSVRPATGTRPTRWTSATRGHPRPRTGPLPSSSLRRSLDDRRYHPTGMLVIRGRDWLALHGKDEA